MAFTQEDEMKLREAKAEYKRLYGNQSNNTNADTLKEYVYRPAARAGKSIAKGFASIGDLANLPVNAALNLAGQPSLQSPSQMIGDFIDQYGGDLTKPRDNLERVIDTAGEFIGGGLPFKTASKVAPIFEKLSPNSVQDLFSFAGAGGASQASHQINPESIIVPLLAGIGGGLVPNAATNIAKTIANPKATTQNSLASLLNINPEKNSAFQQAKLNPTLADVSNSRVVKGGQNILLETPGSTGVIEEAIAKTNDKIKSNFTGLTEAGAGEIAQKTLKNWQTKGSDITGKLKAQVEKHLNPTDKLSLKNTLEVIGKKPKLSEPEILKDFNNSTVGKEYEKFEKIAARNKGLIPFEDLITVRDGISDKITTFALMGDKQQGALKNLRKAITNDINTFFEKKGPQALHDATRYNKFYSNFRKKNDDVVEKILKNKTATESFRAIVNDLPIDGKKAQAVLKSLPKDQKEVFSQSLFRALGENTENEFSVSKFATKFKGLNPEAQAIILEPFSNETKHQLRGIIDAVDNMRSTKANANPSGTFNQGLKLATGAAAWNLPLTTLTTLGGAHIASRLFTNSKFINWLAEAPKFTNPKQQASHISKLERIAKTSPEFAVDIEKYLNDMQQLQQAVHPQNINPYEGMSLEQARELYKTTYGEEFKE